MKHCLEPGMLLSDGANVWTFLYFTYVNQFSDYYYLHFIGYRCWNNLFHSDATGVKSLLQETDNFSWATGTIVL